MLACASVCLEMLIVSRSRVPSGHIPGAGVSASGRHLYIAPLPCPFTGPPPVNTKKYQTVSPLSLSLLSLSPLSTAALISRSVPSPRDLLICCLVISPASQELLQNLVYSWLRDRQGRETGQSHIQVYRVVSARVRCAAGL